MRRAARELAWLAATLVVGALVGWVLERVAPHPPPDSPPPPWRC